MISAYDDEQNLNPSAGSSNLPRKIQGGSTTVTANQIAFVAGAAIVADSD
jgi:hypothetical protein